jgi:opacity protein-like surface antigen
MCKAGRSRWISPGVVVQAAAPLPGSGANYVQNFQKTRKAKMKKSILLAIGLAALSASVVNAQDAAQPVYQYNQIEENHSHIIGIPAVILRFKQWRTQKQLIDAEIEHQRLVNEQLRLQIDQQKAHGAYRAATALTARNTKQKN